MHDLFLSYQYKNKEESQVCLCINEANKFIKIIVIFLIITIIILHLQ